jgi:GTP-binding protein
VGIIGLPNAGKSTLLARISAARPKIARYPFTTLHPYLGIVRTEDYFEFIAADLPGLIEGAHKGKGLGDRFLRHIERTRILVHLIDISPLAPTATDEAYHVVCRELALYGQSLARKPQLVVGNKIDIRGFEDNLNKLRSACGEEVLTISAATGRGIKELVSRIVRLLETVR